MDCYDKAGFKVVRIGRYTTQPDGGIDVIAYIDNLPLVGDLRIAIQCKATKNRIESSECDIIIELLDGTKQYLEVFCVMPNFKSPSKPGEIVVGDVKTHTQTEIASIRQKLLRKIDKQRQFTKPRDNFAVIELNDSLIAGDFAILSSLSYGYKITINKDTMEAVSSGYDWSKSIFDDESTKYLKGIIYFSLGDYQSRKIIMNNNYNII